MALMLFWYFGGLEGKRKERETETELNVEIQGGLGSASGFHEIVLLAPAGRRRGGGFRALMGLKNEFLCSLYCEPCTCYLNLTCHKSNSSKQDGTGLLSTFICVDA